MSIVVIAADGSGQAGPLGLLVIVLLGIAVLFLVRSMAKHLRRVPPSFDPPAAEGAAEGASGGTADREPDDTP